MAPDIIPKRNYFLVGFGIGSLIGVLFAPKSDAETRLYIAKRTQEGKELARKKVREMWDRAEDIVERGKKGSAQAEGRIATAIEAGLETYNREKSKAQVC